MASQSGSTASAPSTVSGWLEATAFVFAIGALTLAYAIGHRLGAHPVAFVLYAVIAASAAMLAMTGLGDHARAIALHPMSWLVGAAIILVEVFYYLTITYVPPAHGNVIFRFAIPIAMLAGWLVFRRRYAPLAVAAAAVVALATGFVVAITDHEVRWAMTASGLAGGAILALRGFASEFHPWNRAARSVREKLRVTGVLLLVTSLLSVALTAILAGAVALSVLPPLRALPSSAQLLHLPTILLGAIAGGGILALMNYLSFSAVVKITTENITAIMALSPLTIWLFQEIGVALGLIAAARPEPGLIAAMAVIIVAVLTILWAGRHGPPGTRAPVRDAPERGPLDSDR